jgi:DNA-binding winged helix-turn-helix (wHTH) protein/Flp pilus assembly protein TadD
MRNSRQTPAEVELDLGRYELRRAGHRIKLEKKPMELLIFLVGRREQLVAREEIIRKLWQSDLFIDADRNLNNIVRKLRTALRDDPARPRFLETVVGKGYRFVGPLRVIDARSASPPPREFPVPGRREDTDRTSLAVLPLLLHGKTLDDDGLCLGVADALVSRLGNLQDIDVLPTSAVLNLPPGAPPLDLAARLGCRFVVHGGLQRSKGQWSISLEMYDALLQRVSFARKAALDPERLSQLETDTARQIAAALNRSLGPAPSLEHPRYSRDALAYAEFVRGFRLSAAGDPALMEKAARHLTAAVSRDPGFALAHATLSFACASRHFETDPASVWLDQAEFHCQRALDLDPNLPEAHVARAFLLWGPSKNFQHLEAITALKRALSLQTNLPHAYNRLGTILAHIGLLGHAHEMYERGRPFQPRKAVSPSVVQVYIWSFDYDRARETITAWKADSPGNKYATYFELQLALMTGEFDAAARLIEAAEDLVPNEPLIVSLEGVLCALTGRNDDAIQCMKRACADPKTFGHAHHSYYQIACILALTGQKEAAFHWLERSVGTGFACWPFFLKDPCLRSLRGMPEFELLISALQARYPDHLGLL